MKCEMETGGILMDDPCSLSFHTGYLPCLPAIVCRASQSARVIPYNKHRKSLANCPNLLLFCRLLFKFSAILKSLMKKYMFILITLLVPDSLYAGSSENEIKQSVTDIYQLGARFEQLIAKHADNEDKVKTGLLSIVNNITTGELQTRWNEFINQTPISSTFYRTVFESMTPQGKLDIQSVSASGSRADVKVKLQISELYTPSIDMITLEELFAKYKITNMTAVDVVNMLPASSLAELVEYRIKSERQDTHHLKLVKGGWKIARIEQNIVSSTIDVILPRKKDAQQ